MKRGRYASPALLRRHFASASFLGGGRTVFNIAGNKYRLVADIRYDLGRVYIRSIMTHAEYARQSHAGRL